MSATRNSLFKLTEGDIECFYCEGYFPAHSFISQDSVDRINKAYAAEVDRLADRREWTALPFAKEAQDELQTQRITGMMERLLSGPVKLWLGMYAIVMPGGMGLGWHQDNQYTHILGHMCNVFVALDAIDTDNAGLWIAPRTHRLGRQPNLNREGVSHRRAADPDNPLAVDPMAPGDAIIFHRELLHHSKTNQSDKPRRAFAFQVSAASCRFAETGKPVEPKTSK